MVSVRETGKHKEYIYRRLKDYANSKQKHVYCGHFHQYIENLEWTALDSVGYNGQYYTILDGKKIIRVYADLHYCMEETDINYKEFRKSLSDKFDVVIFLGDTFDSILLDEVDILKERSFWDELSYLDYRNIPVYFVVGNHDINLCKGEIYKKLLYHKNVSVVDEVETERYVFIHGHTFDPGVKPYLFIFKYGDYIGGKYIRWIWNKIKKWF